MRPPDQLTLTELADALAARQLSAPELLDFFLERAQTTQSRTLAVVDWHETSAREAARVASGGRRRKAQPLAGIPFSVKEALAIQGARHTSGSRYREHCIAERDGVAMGRLRTAGGIPFASTNMSEMGAQWETVNQLYGRTRNPHGAGVTAGGSSGGCGALTAVGGSAFSIGADTGGSIRMPAHFCGVFGHKPTAGLIPIDGHIPLLEGNVAGFCTLGPLTRHAADLETVLRLMAAPAVLAEPTAGGPRRAYLCTRLGGSLRAPDPEMQAAAERAAAALAARGIPVVPIEPKRLGDPFLMWTSLAKVDNSGDLANEVTDGDPRQLRLLRQLLLAPIGGSDHTPWTLTTLVGERWLTPAVRLLMGRYLRQARRVRATLDALLGDGSILLLPTHPRGAFRHDASIFNPTDFAYTGLLNVTGHPGTAVPAGRGRGGLPLSVQVVGARGNDLGCIAVARWLETDLGGWVEPSWLGDLR